MAGRKRGVGRNNVSLPSELELLSAWWSAEKGAWITHFEATYPGETFCRSEVRVSSAAMAGVGIGHRGEGRDAEGIDAVVAAARDQLLEILEREGRPVSLVVTMGTDGWKVIKRGYPG